MISCLHLTDLTILLGYTVKGYVIKIGSRGLHVTTSVGGK